MQQAVTSMPIRRVGRINAAGAWFGRAVLAALAVGCAGPAERSEAPVQNLPGVPVDYHVHILGPDLMRDWRALGVAFSRPDEVYMSSAGLLDGGEHAAAREVLLVPMAHLYGNSELREGLALTLEQERERTARENDFVAAQAVTFGSRAAALCSVSALRPYALEELDRCRQLERVVGIKLHLASSEVDLRDDGHIEAVARLFGWAAAVDLPVLLHLDTQRRGTDLEDIERFLDQALGPSPDLVVVIAHLGGSGGYGRWTQRVFAAVTAWRERQAAKTGAPPQLFYDVSAVLLEQPSEDVPATTVEEAAQLAADLRARAFDGVVFGSDYPVFDPRRGRAALAALAGLSPEEIEAIVTNRVPGWFEPP